MNFVSWVVGLIIVVWLLKWLFKLVVAIVTSDFVTTFVRYFAVGAVFAVAIGAAIPWLICIIVGKELFLCGISIITFGILICLGIDLIVTLFLAIRDVGGIFAPRSYTGPKNDDDEPIWY